MDLKIGNPVTSDEKSCFKLTVYFMLGDADGDEETVEYLSDKSYVLEIVKLLEARVNEKGHLVGPHREPGALSEYIEWPMDALTDWNEYAAYEGYSLVWLDENGIEHEVEVIK